VDNQEINQPISDHLTSEATAKDNSAVMKSGTEAIESEIPRRLAIYITRPDETQNCDFWIGLYKHGNGTPTKLLQSKSIEEFYHIASTDGLPDKKPILLSDTADARARHFYLISENDWMTRPDFAISEISKALNALHPKKAGFYFSSDLVKNPLLTELFRETLIEACKTSTKEYYLFVGNIGINRLVNIAMEVKEALEQETNEQIFVFH
jgi:hypothetical protein